MNQNRSDRTENLPRVYVYGGVYISFSILAATRRVRCGPSRAVGRDKFLPDADHGRSIRHIGTGKPCVTASASLISPGFLVGRCSHPVMVEKEESKQENQILLSRWEKLSPTCRAPHSTHPCGRLQHPINCLDLPKPRKGPSLWRWGEEQSGTCYGLSLHVARGHLPTTSPEGTPRVREEESKQHVNMY